jgi:hypothetical protein
LRHHPVDVAIHRRFPVRRPREAASRSTPARRDKDAVHRRRGPSSATHALRGRPGQQAGRRRSGVGGCVLDREARCAWA